MRMSHSKMGLRSWFLENTSLHFQERFWRTDKHIICENLQSSFFATYYYSQLHSTTVGLNLAVIIMFNTPNIPEVYCNLLVVPDVALVNIMACIVHRNICFGTFRKVASNFSIGRSRGPSIVHSGIVFKQNSIAESVQVPARKFPAIIERGRLDQHRSMQMNATELDGMHSDINTIKRMSFESADK